MARKIKDESLIGNLCTLIVDHQLGLSVNLLLLLSLTHLCFPRARQSTRAYFELSYRDPVTGQYIQGWNDAAFVAFWVVIFTGLRVVVMDYILEPLARRGGIIKKKSQVRFAEQGWLCLYDTASWSVGMYIMYNSDYWFNLTELWTNFPTMSTTGLVKWYYLVQLAFWFQQILVVNIEEKRKDYAQMFTHHIITSALIMMSYGYYQTKVGNLILVIMDGVDILLEFAKVLRYLNYRTACDTVFGVFIVAWFVCRHVCYLMICWSIHAVVPTTMPYGCYDSKTGAKLTSTVSNSSTSYPSNGGSEIMTHIMQSFRDPGGVVCFNNRIRHAFLALLLGLQVITLIWFYMIIRVAWRVITGKGADDTRSDDEESEEEDIEEESEKQTQTNLAASTGKSVASVASGHGLVPLEEEVGVEELNFGRRTSPGVRVRRPNPGVNGRGAAMSTSRDRKELLGRIGCDGPS